MVYSNLLLMFCIFAMRFSHIRFHRSEVRTPWNFWILHLLLKWNILNFCHFVAIKSLSIGINSASRILILPIVYEDSFKVITFMFINNFYMLLGIVWKYWWFGCRGKLGSFLVQCSIRIRIYMPKNTDGKLPRQDTNYEYP